MRFYVIAGEASGDLHGSNLIKELKLLIPNAEFRCWGGDLMKEQGAHLVRHYRELAFMGFSEVLRNLPAIFRNIAFCKKDIKRWNPDALVLIDYPGFNLRIAGFAKETGLKVFYYISPQVWAWKQSRVQKIKKVVDKMFVILPFEKAFYKKFGYAVDFVGHPLLDVIKSFDNPNFETFIKENNLPAKPIVAVLPGSRKQEIARMLPVMLSVKKRFADYQFVVAAAPSQPKERYERHISDNDTHVVYGKTYQLLQHAEAAIVTSGTATLETALFDVPEVICYKGGWISYYIARQLIKVSYISLVNLIMKKAVVKELIQREFNSSDLEEELNNLLQNNDYREHMINDFRLLKEKLGGSGASRQTALLMLKTLLGV